MLAFVLGYLRSRSIVGNDGMDYDSTYCQLITTGDVPGVLHVCMKIQKLLKQQVTRSLPVVLRWVLTAYFTGGLNAHTNLQ